MRGCCASVGPQCLVLGRSFLLQAVVGVLAAAGRLRQRMQPGQGCTDTATGLVLVTSAVLQDSAFLSGGDGEVVLGVVVAGLGVIIVVRGVSHIMYEEAHSNVLSAVSLLAGWQRRGLPALT